jgi:hypothetical protein
MDTAAKGRRFEYAIRNIFLNQGYVVGRCAASKPWDLTVATTRATYAIECKASKPNLRQTYKELQMKLMIGSRKLLYSKLFPLLFYVDGKGNIQMYTEVHFTDEEGIERRPFFNGEAFAEIHALGINKE